MTRHHGETKYEEDMRSFEEARDDALADALDDWADCKSCGQRRDIGDVDARGVCAWCGGSA